MAGVYGEINGRSDFFKVLQSAIQEARAILARNPGDQTVLAILRQLEAVATWTANGRTPTKDERQSIDFALRASREFEGIREMYKWTRALYALDAYVADWPSDDRAATATDEDFWDSDDEDE